MIETGEIEPVKGEESRVNSFSNPLFFLFKTECLLSVTYIGMSIPAFKAFENKGNPRKRELPLKIIYFRGA